MPDSLQTLDTLTNDKLEAIIDRAEAILQERLAKVPLREDLPSACGQIGKICKIAPHGFANYLRADGLTVIDTDFSLMPGAALAWDSIILRTPSNAAHCTSVALRRWCDPTKSRLQRAVFTPGVLHSPFLCLIGTSVQLPLPYIASSIFVC